MSTFANWHWKEIDCQDWTHVHLPITLANPDFSTNEYKITEVTGIKGPAVLSQRKGKTMAIFDLSFTLKLTKDGENDLSAFINDFCSEMDSSEIKISGIPEISKEFVLTALKQAKVEYVTRLIEEHKNLILSQEQKVSQIPTSFQERDVIALDVDVDVEKTLSADIMHAKIVSPFEHIPKINFKKSVSYGVSVPEIFSYLSNLTWLQRVLLPDSKIEGKWVVAKSGFIKFKLASSDLHGFTGKIILEWIIDDVSSRVLFDLSTKEDKNTEFLLSHTGIPSKHENVQKNLWKKFTDSTLAVAFAKSS